MIGWSRNPAEVFAEFVMKASRRGLGPFKEIQEELKASETSEIPLTGPAKPDNVTK